jgi:hypothetical protein
MDTPRIKMGHAYGEVYPNVFSDFAWVREHRDDLLETYGECVILVYEKQVIGKGHTIQEAAEEAERTLPAAIHEITPITEFLHHRHPFYRVRSAPNHEK